VSEEKITNVVASLSTAPINTPTQLQSARQAPARVFKLRTCQPSFCGRANHPLTHNANDLLADVQQVDVSFVIQRGSSNALTPMQLATAYTSAVKDGNETRSAAYFTSLTKEKAVTGPTKATPATEASVTVETDSVTEVAGAAVEDEKGPGMIVMAAIAVAGLCFIMILAYLLKKQCSSSNDVAKISPKPEDAAEKKAEKILAEGDDDGIHAFDDSDAEPDDGDLGRFDSKAFE
jgi:hypothetical protein